MFKKLMGIYPPPMAEVMADDTPGETKSVLDLGCGSGSWYECLPPIIDVAEIVPMTFQDIGGCP
jgi:predicted TPR repeat methyltransferase